MNREQIIRMAREAGFEGCAELTWENVICTEELEHFATLVAEQAKAEEREACAKVCEDNFSDGALNLADAIRARGNKHD